MDTLSERATLRVFGRIEYFLSVGQTPEFYQGCRECYVAQAAISQQIKQFEEELGFKLFDRGGTAVALTPRRGVFCPPMSDVLSQQTRGRCEAVQGPTQTAEQDLRLASTDPHPGESIPGYLRQFQLYPLEAAIHLREGGTGGNPGRPVPGGAGRHRGP